MGRLIKLAAVSMAQLLMISGCAFVHLKNDIEDGKRTAFVTSMVEGVSGDAPVYVVLRVGTERRAVLRLAPGLRDFGLLVRVGERNDLFAFQDSNRNQRYDEQEPFGELRALGGVKPLGRSTTRLPEVVLTTNTAVLATFDLTEVKPEATSTFGEVVALDDARYSDERVSEGMWLPITAASRGGYGIHFVEPHREGRTPVLFVHGINGSPRNFTALLEHLDRTKYEPWVAYYPSGIRLPVLAEVFAQLLVRAKKDLGLTRIVVVAHSMGGLVSRGALLRLAERGETSLVSTYISLSTPYGGHSAAATGLEYAPQAVPSWIDIAPGSAYLRSLQKPLPMPFFLFFGVGGRGDRLDDNNDGVVAVESQIVPWAQDEAQHIYGFNLSHGGILNSTDVEAKLWPLLQ